MTENDMLVLILLDTTPIFKINMFTFFKPLLSKIAEELFSL